MWITSLDNDYASVDTTGMKNTDSHHHDFRPLRTNRTLCDVCLRSAGAASHTAAIKNETSQPVCRKCGEPEMLGLPDSGDFGWFTNDEGTWCNRCGTKSPEKKSRSRVG